MTDVQQQQQQLTEYERFALNNIRTAIGSCTDQRAVFEGLRGGTVSAAHHIDPSKRTLLLWGCKDVYVDLHGFKPTSITVVGCKRVRLTLPRGCIAETVVSRSHEIDFDMERMHDATTCFDVSFSSDINVTTHGSPLFLACASSVCMTLQRLPWTSRHHIHSNMFGDRDLRLFWPSDREILELMDTDNGSNDNQETSW